ETFADRGPDALKEEALDALKNRPDETTVAAVVDTYSDVGATDALIGSALSGAANLPQEKRQLLTYALNLLTCEYGRACGPNSSAVAVYCVSLGACEPGADLQSLYADVLLSRTEFENVQSVLAMLRASRSTH